MNWHRCEAVEGGTVWVNFDQVLTFRQLPGEPQIIRLTFAGGDFDVCGDAFDLLHRIHLPKDR